jgi:hypothetical protein
MYFGPYAPGSACDCSTVVYSLISACGRCQGRNFISCVIVNNFNADNQLLSSSIVGLNGV